MIVSHKHRFIFLKPRKVAGTSFEIALSKYCGEDDIITPISRDDEAIRRVNDFMGPRNFNFGLAKLLASNPNSEVKLFGYALPLKFYNHIPAKLARSRLKADVWNSYRKISLVRNPWDRTVSIFFWKNTKRKSKPNLANFTSYFKANPYLLETNYSQYMIDGKDIVDTYIRYEHFQEDILKLEAEMPVLEGLWNTFKHINAKTDTRDRSKDIRDIFRENPEIDRMIRERNAWEIEKFSYSL